MFSVLVLEILQLFVPPTEVGPGVVALILMRVGEWWRFCSCSSEHDDCISTCPSESGAHLLCSKLQADAPWLLSGFKGRAAGVKDPGPGSGG